MGRFVELASTVERVTGDHTHTPTDSGHSHHHDGHSHASPANADGTATRPRKQEQLPASDEITEVAPGVLCAQLPIDLPGLGHVNCYLLEDERGVAIVDPGLPGKKPFQALVAKLAKAGFPLKRVHTVIVTHSHPDHFGGVGLVRKETGAEVVAHKAFSLWWDPNEPDDVDVETLALTRQERANHQGRTPWGSTPPRPPRKRRLAFEMRRRLPMIYGTPRPSVRLDDAQTIRLARRDWVAVHTPGHTVDHLCLFDPAEGVLISGDHVLPTITPHISGLIAVEDPLLEFFRSLDKVADVADKSKVVLPAHGLPFADVRARTEAIKRHHVERLERLHTGSKDFGRFASVTEFSGVLFSPRAQGAMADSETYAHLEHLRLIGQAERREASNGAEYLVG